MHAYSGRAPLIPPWQLGCSQFHTSCCVEWKVPFCAVATYGHNTLCCITACRPCYLCHVSLLCVACQIRSISITESLLMLEPRDSNGQTPFMLAHLGTSLPSAAWLAMTRPHPPNQLLQPQRRRRALLLSGQQWHSTKQPCCCGPCGNLPRDRVLAVWGPTHGSWRLLALKRSASHRQVRKNTVQVSCTNPTCERL